MSYIGIASSTVFFLLSAVITVYCLAIVGVKKQNYSGVKSNAVPVAGVIASVLAVISSLYAIMKENNGFGFSIPASFIFISLLNLIVLVFIIKKKQIDPRWGVITVGLDAIPVLIGGGITIYALVTSGGK